MQAERPKKIVINNVRKSMVLGRNSVVSPKQHSNYGAASEVIEENHSHRQQEYHDRIDKMAEQVKLYREKHDQSLIKVRFLSDQLQTVGALDKVPESIRNQIGETDTKIKNLEELLYFKRSKQMRKLRRRVKKFIEMLEFEVTDEDMDKMEDELQIIFFMMDLFTEKYNQLMTEKVQIDQIVEKLKEDTVFNRDQLEDQNTFLQQKNMELTEYVRDLELELFNLKRDNYHKSSFEGAIRSQNVRIYDDNIRNLQAQNQNLSSRLKDLENQLREKQFALINSKRKFDDSESNLARERAKIRDLQFELERVQKEEVRWKERYSVMEQQKNERIRLLENQKRKLEDVQLKIINGGFKKTSKRGRFGDRVTFDPQFACQEEIGEESGEEYFDLSER